MRSNSTLLLPALLLGLVAGSGQAVAAPKASAIPTQDIYADNGEVKTVTGAVHFAVVGDTRDAIAADKVNGRVSIDGAEQAIVADLMARVDEYRLKFAVLLGNMVTTSSTGEWKNFNRDWQGALAGSQLSEAGGTRLKSLPVCGTSDRTGDEWLTGFGAAFPGVGADIGANRVASWYTVDISADGKVWRLLVVDSDKAALGSRWDEQLAWIPEALKGDEYQHLLVFMNQPPRTVAHSVKENEGGGPGELMETIEDSTKLNMVTAVFAANTGTNEIYLPGGRMGEAYINVSSGAPAATLPRWRTTPELKLESIFDLQLIKAFDHAVEVRALAETVVDHAKARGSYEGFVGEYDARAFPVAGWWNVSIAGDSLSLDFRMWDPSGSGENGSVAAIYHADWDRKGGWRIGMDATK